MNRPLLLDAEAVKQRLMRVYQRQRGEWLTGEGEWPLVIHLGLPDQKTALNNRTAMGSWIDHWRHWRGAGELTWCSRDWPVLGRQELPEKIIFTQIEQVLQWLDQTANWKQAHQRYCCLLERWPQVQRVAVKYHDVLAEYSAENFSHLQQVLDWLVSHPHSQMYSRQIPIAGIDTKWLESRQGLISDFFQAICHVPAADFHSLTGLKREPDLVRVRILDARLRQIIGGISDLSASVDELARLNFPVERVYIVENLRTGLAFADLPGAVVFMGLGYGVNKLAAIPWIKSAACYYWGDLDTHGFAILNRARAHFPAIHSLLMDEQTLFCAKSLWGSENKPCRAENLEYLTKDEIAIYRHLRDNTWGFQIRLEQERIFWEYAWQVLLKNIPDLFNKD